MKDLGAVLAAFSEATTCTAVVWTQAAPDAPLRPEFGRPAGGPPTLPELMPSGSAPIEVHNEGCTSLVARVPGPRRAWLALGPCPDVDPPRRTYLDFLLPVVAHFLQAALEVEHAANELAERYEEINLLYTMSEILGRTVALEEAAARILKEISETVGARCAAILVHDPTSDTLNVVAAIGGPTESTPPVRVTDPRSVSARVFRTQHSTVVDDHPPHPHEAPYCRGLTLSVPIMWTSPDGAVPLGVVNLSDRRTGLPFTAGDQKLVEAIATQIGTAIQNARLVRASLSQQQLLHELTLAHDLQMKLLPAAGVVAPEAQVAARVVPAESVGGDFYHLFRLGPARTGVMIGDVSSHGYRAALIMALAMSASAIHAQTSADAAATLRALHASLRDELQSTEMFITTFFGVIDRSGRELRYANAGHPHAFVVSASGAVDRLPALDPPLGMADDEPHGASRPWAAGEDLLLLFTDGVSDARDAADHRLGEQPVLDVVRAHRAESPERILTVVLERLRAHIGDVPRRDDLAVVVVKS